MRILLGLSFKGLYNFFTNRSFRTFAYLAGRYGSKPRYQHTKIRAGGYTWEVPDALSFIWQFYEIFFKRSYQFTADNPKPVIFDCGANVGMSCLFFKQIYPQADVRAFEPDPTVFKALESNLTRNGASDVTLINAAVWKEDGKLEFSSEGADGGSVLTAQQSATIEVDAIRLKDWIEKEKTIDLLKIDIEGAEVQVIEDCAESLQNVKHLFVEYHSYNDQPQHLDNIIKVISQNGFRYYLENEATRKLPFVNQLGKNGMDMQVNIFAYR